MAAQVETIGGRGDARSALENHTTEVGGAPHPAHRARPDVLPGPCVVVCREHAGVALLGAIAAALG
jgi:hypothetical protein